jgi:hypothetical protein
VSEFYEEDLTVIPGGLDHVMNAATFTLGTIWNVNDEMGLGQSRIQVDKVFDEGKENWTYWCPVIGNQISGNDQRVASGMWWPGQPGDICLVGFKDGDFLQPFAIPGIVQAKKPQPGNAILPAEIKTLTDRNTREGTRSYYLGTPAGHTLFFSDVAGREGGYLTDCWGQGLFWVANGKGQDPKEEAGGPSKVREGYTRQDNTVFTQTAKRPGEILKTGESLMGLMDLNGSGLTMLAKEGAGSLIIQANNTNGSVKGPSIIIDALAEHIVMTAGGTQLVVDGPQNQVEATRLVVQEKMRIEIEPTIQKFKDFIKDKLKYFSKSASAASPQGETVNSNSSGSSSTGSSSGSSGSGSNPGVPSNGMAGGDSIG